LAERVGIVILRYNCAVESMALHSRRFVIAFLLCCSVTTAGALHAQEVAPGVAIPAPEAPAQTTATSAEWRDVSWRKLPSNFLRDQKDMWLFPTKLARGRHWVPTVAVVGITAALLAADSHDAPYFRRTASFRDFNRAMNGKATALEISLVPAAIYFIGLARKDSYAQKTALFAGEALADCYVLYAAINVASRRLRPSDIAPNGNFSDTFFRSHQHFTGSSFPSGHTIKAFAVATVIARRYRHHRWVPWVAYGVAGLIGFSRITLQSHFPADVFLGAALGYSISRFNVLRGR
jgi:membrane-associated phospholipid phosphatase